MRVFDDNDSYDNEVDDLAGIEPSCRDLSEDSSTSDDGEPRGTKVVSDENA